jgi:lipopolysaccharide export system protein LptA
MRLSVERVRWGLLAGALLLVGVVVVLLSYGRYRAVEAWKQIVQRSGATITHETNGVTWSQALGGKQIFTLHGKHVIPHGDGKYTLEDGMLLLYGPNGQPSDRISGAQFDYDEKQGVAHAAGIVDMDIEPPAGLSPQGPNGETARAIHVRTSGLTYVKKLGVAATDQDVEIEYAGMHGHAKGAEFDTGLGVVHLLADVRAEGTLRGTAATLTATKADLNRDQNVIELTGPVVRTGGRTGSAASAVLHLRKDGTVEVVEASGGVTLKQDTRTITAATLHAAMNERSQMQHAELGGGVAMLDTNAERPTHAVANTAKIVCDAAGYPTSAVMDGAVALTMEDRRGSGQALGRQMGAEHVTLAMERVSGKRGGSRVSGVHAVGGAWARGNSLVQAAGKSGLKLTTVAGDDLQLALVQDAQGKDQPQSLSGNGHTRIEQRMPDGTVQTSEGDVLNASFAEQGARGLEIASAEQTGHVEIRSVPGKQGAEPSEAVAERVQLDGANDVVTLTSPQRASSSGSTGGRPRLKRGDTSVTADTVRMMQQTGDVVANGNVAATFVSANAKAGGSGSRSGVTHALAQEAVLHRTAQTMELKGTDAAPARMWQGASQVEAANLLLDRGRDSMQAWPQGATGVVRSVFANQGSGIREQGSGNRERREGPKARGLEGQGAGERVVRVTSSRLDYSGVSHEAVFTGGVMVQGEDGQAQAQRGVAFLTPKGSGVRDQGSGDSEAHVSDDKPPQRASSPGTPATVAKIGHPESSSGGAKGQPDPVASSVEKIVMSGAVKVEQPGRTATGDQLLYTAATGEFVLTGTPGHPPHVVDDKQGSITGATLLFRSPDSTIVVAGEAASRRVHTETTMKK